MERQRRHIPDNLSPEFEQVIESQKNLADFLRMEIELSLTMLKLLKTTRDGVERRQQLLGSVDSAVKTIQHFEHRLRDETVRREILEQVQHLQAALDKQTPA